VTAEQAQSYSQGAQLNLVLYLFSDQSLCVLCRTGLHANLRALVNVSSELELTPLPQHAAPIADV
jgi:hypothetical protein